MNGEGTNSAQAIATPQTPAPAAPTGLGAVGGVGAVTLSWNTSVLATNYFVKRSTTSGGPYSVAGITASTGFVDTNVTVEVPCFYVVSALNSGGESPNSVEASATPRAPPLLGAHLDAGAGQLILSWPGWAASFELFAATNLVPPVQWSPVTNAVTPGDPITVIVPIQGGTRFFRLIQW